MVKGSSVSCDGGIIIYDKLADSLWTVVGHAIYRVENVDRYDDRLQVTTNLIEAYDLLMEFVSKHTQKKDRRAICVLNGKNSCLEGDSSEMVGCPLLR